MLCSVKLRMKVRKTAGRCCCNCKKNGTQLSLQMLDPEDACGQVVEATPSPSTPSPCEASCVEDSEVHVVPIR